MAKSKKITPEQLSQYIDTELNAATSYNSKVSLERERALNYFNKQPYGNERKGRSTYVSSEVQETISWALPQLMKIFSGQDIVKFDSSIPNQAEVAQMATAYANQVFYKDNAGFLILHDWFQDALLQKNGFIKIYFDKEDTYEREEYKDLTDNELAFIINDKNVEPLTHDLVEVRDPISNQVIISKHDLTIKRKVQSIGGKIKIENCPVEEILVSKHARSLNLDDANFIAHRVKRTISWLREQGYKIEDDIADGLQNSSSYSQEKITREYLDGNWDQINEEVPADPSMRYVWVTEVYLKIDFNNDGIAETRRVLKVGDKILENEEVYGQPFVSISPYPQSHQFNGLSMADLVMDLQLLKSMVMRSMLDSFAFNISPSKIVDVSKVVDVNDLLDSAPGNFIRMRGDVGQAFSAVPSTGVGDAGLNLLSYVDNIAESRSGVSKMTQGITENMFNKTATGTQAIMSASQEKLALIVRLFAETGIKPLFRKIIELASKYSDGPEMIELNSQFIEVNPMQWKSLKSISVNVGTGSLDKQTEIQNLQMLLSLQDKIGASQHPELMAMLDPIKIHNGINDLTKNMGYNNANEYFNKPGSPEYTSMLQYIQQQMQPPAPIPDANMAYVEVQKEKQKQDMLLDTANFELNKLKADREFELKKLETQLKYELEVMKLAKVDETSLMTSQIDQLGLLNPSNDLLPASEIGALTKVIENAGGNPQQASLYAQLLDTKHQQENALEELRKQKQAETENIMSMLHTFATNVSSSKRVVRDENGDIIGLENVPSGLGE